MGQLTTANGQISGSATTCANAMIYDHAGRRSALTETLAGPQIQQIAPQKATVPDAVKGGGGGSQTFTQFFQWDGEDMVYRQLAGPAPTTSYTWTDLPGDDNGVLYIYGPTGLVMEFNRTNSSTLLFDPNGSCVQSSNGAAGNGNYYVGDNYGPTLYDAYGQLIWAPAEQNVSLTTVNLASAQPYQYKGQYGYYTDGATGLIYCINRYYDPIVGRWTSRDPSGLDGGVNVYAYCDGDPIELIDPNGRQGYVDAAAGAGDALTFGLTKIARRAIGNWLKIGDANEAVNYNSLSYMGGEISGTMFSCVLPGPGELKAVQGTYELLKSVGGAGEAAIVAERVVSSGAKGYEFEDRMRKEMGLAKETFEVLVTGPRS